MLRYLQPRSTSNSSSEHPAKRQRTVTSAASVQAAAATVDRSNTVTPAGAPQGEQLAGRGISESVQRKLQSVELHICSQNLETPHPAGNAPPLTPPDEADEFAFHGAQAEAEGSPADDGEFVIHCSQVYQRTQSTQQPGLSSQTDSRSGVQQASARVQRRTPPGGTPSGPLRESDTRSAGNAMNTTTAGASVAAGAATAGAVPGSAAQTPELSRDDEPRCSVMTKQSPGKALFPLFRPVNERKLLYLIRHGQSEFNAATISQPSFSDPTIFDAKLTSLGRQQCEKLRNQLSRLPKLKDALWIVSPLQRALETLQLGCPFTDRLRDEPAAQGAPQLLISGVLAEHCATSGDVGSPASQLRAQYRLLAPFMADLPERWWYSPHANCATKERMGAWEPMAKMKERVGEFRKLLHRQPHQVIVCIGHSTFFREFIGANRGTRLRNCEVHMQNL